MNATAPIRATAGLTLLAAAGLVAADTNGGSGARVGLGIACVLLTILALATRLQIGRERRRERRAIGPEPRVRRPRSSTSSTGGRQTVAGTVLALAGVVVGLLAVQSILGISFWALVLLLAGGVVIWAQTVDLSPEDRSPSGWQRLVGRRGDGSAPSDRLQLASGIALVVLGALVALSSVGALGATRTSVLQTLVVLAAILTVIAPYWLRSARRVQAERTERIRGDEREEVAAHLHDSVLQTLALIQRRSDDPREVASLARRQERELRLWLSGRSERPDDELMAALRATAAAVELEHRVEIEVVTSGTWRLDDRAAALLAAAREAMANAARHGCPETARPAGAAAGDPSPIAVFAEANDQRVEVFVRDRGVGFDPDAVPPDRRGVRESIVGRMRRTGGRATIHSTPGEGTEVELLLEDHS